MGEINYKIQLKKLKKCLEEHRRDCLQLKKKDDLTLEGKGMLMLINDIYEEMRWKIINRC